MSGELLREGENLLAGRHYRVGVAALNRTATARALREGLERKGLELVVDPVRVGPGAFAFGVLNHEERSLRSGLTTFAFEWAAAGGFGLPTNAFAVANSDGPPNLLERIAIAATAPLVTGAGIVGTAAVSVADQLGQAGGRIGEGLGDTLAPVSDLASTLRWAGIGFAVVAGIGALVYFFPRSRS